MEYIPYNLQKTSTDVAVETFVTLGRLVKEFEGTGEGIRDGVVDVWVNQGGLLGWGNFAYVRMGRCSRLEGGEMECE